MNEIFKYFTKEKIDNIALTVFIIAVLAIIYSIIAGIWGFAPVKNMNWKIFGTSIVIAIIAVIVAYINDEAQ